MNVYLSAAARALPIALCLPLPGIAARVALGAILALAATGVPGLSSMSASQWVIELWVGLGLGLFVAAPVIAARYAGGLLAGTLARRPSGSMAALYTSLAWIFFAGSGGLSLLLDAYLSSYAHRPTMSLAENGARFVQLAASLALPALLAVAVVEICAAIITRFEDGAGFDLGALRLAQAARPLVVLLLVVASLAALGRGVSAATHTVAGTLH